MASALGELELEALGESESEFEHEFEHELPEMFGWGDVTNWAGDQWNALNTPGSWQRKALLAADKAVLTGGGAALGGALGGPPGVVAGGALGAGASTLLPDREFESEFETEFELETEFEGEGEISPVTRIYPDAMMEHFGHAAMEAESEHEAAEGFLPLIPLVASKLVPLAAKALPRIAGRVLPRVARAVSRVTPHLTRSVGNLTRTLYRNPRTRPLLRAVPSIARRAVTSIARQAAAGRPVTPTQAVRIMARQNHRVLSNPQTVRRVLRRSRLLDGRYHRLAGIPAVGRNYRWRWRNGVWQPGMAAGVPGLPGPRPMIAGDGVTRVCPTCGSTTVHTQGGRGCSVVVVR
jgi:hypothetical protein